MNEIQYQSQQERKSDSRSELKNKHLKVLLLQIHAVPAAVRAIQAAVQVRIQAAAKPRLHHRCRLTKAIRQKRQKVTHGVDMELEGLVMESERDRLPRYSDCDFLMQVKQNADVYLDRFFSDDRRKRETVKKELIQLGVHPSVHVAEVFSSPATALFVHRFGLTPGLAFDLRTPILIVGSWNGHSAGMSHMR